MVADQSANPSILRVATTRLPTRHGDFVALAYSDLANGSEHLALLLGPLDAPTGVPPLVRLHSECLGGDELDAAQEAVAAEGHGVVVYLRGRSGRGTVPAEGAPGHSVAAHDYGAAAAILADLGMSAIRLLSSDPDQEVALRASGIQVIPLGLRVPPRPDDLGWSQLLAGCQPVTGELARRYGPLVAAGPRFVMAQLGQSVDGFIASRSGDARFVTGAADRLHLHRLRALVEAVVVGVETVIVDDCRLTVRAVPGPSPVRVILDPNRRVPSDAHVLRVGDAPTLLVVADDGRVPGSPAPHVEVLPLPRTDRLEGFDPHVVVAALAERGLGRVLVEGGGITVSRFVAARALDRLLVTTAPLLVGDGVPGLRFAGADRLSDALRAPARRFVSGEDVCVELDLAAPSSRPLATSASYQHGDPGQHRDGRQDAVAGCE